MTLLGYHLTIIQTATYPRRRQLTCSSATNNVRYISSCLPFGLTEQRRSFPASETMFLKMYRNSPSKKPSENGHSIAQYLKENNFKIRSSNTIDWLIDKLEEDEHIWTAKISNIALLTG